MSEDTFVRRATTARGAGWRTFGGAGRVFPSLLVLLLLGLLLLGLRIPRPVRAPASAVPLHLAVRPLAAPVGRAADGSWYKGRPDAPVTVVEFGDFQRLAGFEAFQLVEGGIDDDFVATGRVRLVFHEYPRADRPNAVLAAEAARVAGDQGRFWAMHDLLYARQAEWANDREAATLLKGYAAELGLDQRRFDRSLDAGAHAAGIRALIADGQRRGIAGSPTYLVDGVATDAGGLRAAIAEALRVKDR